MPLYYSNHRVKGRSTDMHNAGNEQDSMSIIGHGKEQQSSRNKGSKQQLMNVYLDVLLLHLIVLFPPFSLLFALPCVSFCLCLFGFVSLRLSLAPIDRSPLLSPLLVTMSTMYLMSWSSAQRNLDSTNTVER